jgi:hypothetical protein
MTAPLSFFKGAIVGIDPLNPVASVIVFQYNPETLTRSLSARSAGAGGAKDDAFRLGGPPEETIDLTVELDATDALERGSHVAVATGIHPQLAALEMLLYPKAARVLLGAALSLAGGIEIDPPEAPLTLFVWGARRVLPVRLTSFSITEQDYDARLNPIRAQVKLGLRVLSYADLPFLHPGSALFLAHQVAKETMATLGQSRNLSALAGGPARL